MPLSHNQAKNFAVLIKCLINPFIEQNKIEYIEYLNSIKDNDEDARKELELLNSNIEKSSKAA